MKYLLTSLLCIFLLNVNFAQSDLSTTRAERSQLGQIEQTKKSATKTFMVSLERYREAVKILDEDSQTEIKKDVLLRMTEVIANSENVLKEAPRSAANKTQLANTKSMITQQNSILKKVEKTKDAQETERLMVEFVETLKM